MPLQTNVTEEEKKQILHLRSRGLSIMDIAIITRRGTHTVSNIIRENKDESQ